MRLPQYWVQAVESARECALQTLHCGLNVCEKLAAANPLMTPAYPPVEVIVAGPAFVRAC